MIFAITIMPPVRGDTNQGGLVCVLSQNGVTRNSSCLPEPFL
jgi:hypothetical protein